MPTLLTRSPATTPVAGTDLLYIVQDPAGTPTEGKLPVSDVTAGRAVSVLTLTATDTTQSTSTTTGSGIFGGGVGIAKNLYVGGEIAVGSNLPADPDGPLHVHKGSAGTVAPDSSFDVAIFENSGAGGVSVLIPDANMGGYAIGSPSDNLGAAFVKTYSSNQTKLYNARAGGSLVLGGDNNVDNIVLTGASGAELATFVRNVALTNGNLTISTGDLIITTSTTPASAGAAGVAGTVAWDADFIYICTATNTWKRVAIATW